MLLVMLDVTVVVLRSVDVTDGEDWVPNTVFDDSITVSIATTPPVKTDVWNMTGCVCTKSSL